MTLDGELHKESQPKTYKSQKQSWCQRTTCRGCRAIICQGIAATGHTQYAWALCIPNAPARTQKTKLDHFPPRSHLYSGQPAEHINKQRVHVPCTFLLYCIRHHTRHRFISLFNTKAYTSKKKQSDFSSRTLPRWSECSLFVCCRTPGFTLHGAYGTTSVSKGVQRWKRGAKTKSKEGTL